MRVGREVKRQVLAEELKKRKVSAPAMSEEERKAMKEALMRLPKDRIVPALRSAGLSEEADEVEQQFAQEHLREMRDEQLAKINALPADERLEQLIANGFKEEAKALSEELAAKEEEVSEPDVKEEEEPKTAKKKGGRPKKNAKK